MPETAIVAPPTTAAQPALRVSRDQDIATDGDLRYNAGVVGYPRDNRKRLRDTEHQVNLLVTARIRDTSTAVNELQPATLLHGLRTLAHVIELANTGRADMTDVRAEFVSIAATATICAEACDRPASFGGARLLRSSGHKQLRVA
jgi:hypothetical protein